MPEEEPVTCNRYPNERAADKQQGTRPKLVLEFVGALFALAGIAIGVLTLRFALGVMQGGWH